MPEEYAQRAQLEDRADVRRQRKTGEHGVRVRENVPWFPPEPRRPLTSLLTLDQRGMHALGPRTRTGDDSVAKGNLCDGDSLCNAAPQSPYEALLHLSGR